AALGALPAQEAGPQVLVFGPPGFSSAMVIEEQPTLLAQAKPDAKADEELGFVDRFFGFGVGEGVDKRIDENGTVLTILGFLLPVGPVWVPMLILPEEGRPKINSDIVISWLVPELISLPGYICLCVPGLILHYMSGQAALRAWDRAY